MQAIKRDLKSLYLFWQEHDKRKSIWGITGGARGSLTHRSSAETMRQIYLYFCFTRGLVALFSVVTRGSHPFHHTGELLLYSYFGISVFNKWSPKLQHMLELCFLAFHFSFLFLATSFVSLFYREVGFAHKLLLSTPPAGSSWRQQGMTAHSLSAMEGR